MNYRLNSQAAAVILHSILGARGQAKEIRYRDWNGVTYMSVQDPIHLSYLNDCFTVIKSVLKIQKSAVIKLQFMHKNHLREEWLVSAETVSLPDCFAKEMQALVNQINASDGFLSELGPGITFRVLVSVADDLELPSKCSSFENTESLKLEPESGYAQTDFRPVSGIGVEIRHNV